MSKEQEKLVSIGLFTFNGAGTIRRAIDSLLFQTYPHFELIISDNASTDDTSKICRAYAAKDRRIRYFRQKENRGAVKNFLFVVGEAEGEYFMWAADDDWYDPRFIELLVEKLKRFPGCGAAMSSFERRYPDGSIKDRILFQGDLELGRLGQKKLFEKIILGEPLHVLIYGLFRKDFVVELTRRGYADCIRADRIMMAEATLATCFVSVNSILYHRTYRVEKHLRVDPKYRTDSIGLALKSPLKHTKYIFCLLWRLLSSPLIPGSKKFFILGPWLIFCWRKRRTLVKELISIC